MKRCNEAKLIGKRWWSFQLKPLKRWRFEYFKLFSERIVLQKVSFLCKLLKQGNFELIQMVSMSENVGEKFKLLAERLSYSRYFMKKTG